MKYEQGEKVLMLASVASMIDQFNMPNIRLMLDLGYEVHVACNFEKGNTCDERQIHYLKKKLCKMHVMWHQWDCPRSICCVRKCVKAYRQLWKLTKEHHFVWMHCHSPIGGALARMVAQRRKIRVIYTAHGFHFYRGAPWKNWLLYYPAEALLAHWTDVLVTVNQEDYRFARRHLKAGKIYKIPGIGIDIGRFWKHSETQGQPGRLRISISTMHGEFRKRYKIPEEAIILLSVGELSKRKNHQAVILALAGLQRKDVYYFICGQGPLEESLKSYAAMLGVQEQIRMPGFQRNVIQMYQNADVFVFPSKQEGMPVALMEAMAAGMPCVVSDIRGNRELISSDMCFALGQPEQLLQILHLLLDDEQMRRECGMCNQKRIREYDHMIVQKKMIKIYANMKSEND